MIDNAAYAEQLRQYRLKQAIAHKRCDELNQDKTTLNRMGGIGYYARYGRVICNSPKKEAS